MMRGTRKKAIGTVVGDRMDKTAVVEVVRIVRERRYHKYIRRSKKYKVHDEQNRAGVGDRVEIAECRPFSKTKAWRLVRVIEKSPARQASPGDRAQGG